MDILAARALRASSLVFQQGTESPTLAVVAKVTFHLTTGKVRLAEPDIQEPIIEEDSHWDDDPGRSLRFASDLVPNKGRVDVLLDASAQAPADGRPNVVMRLMVGERARPLVDKLLLVSPPQFVMPNGSVQREPWPSSLSIRYERSAGGRGTANPAGVDPNGPQDAKGRLPRPSVEVFPGKPACEPIGFGPIAPLWPARMAKWTDPGRHLFAQDWQRRPFSADFRWSYFNVAPEDQQIDAILQGNERIVLENIVSNVPVFETQLVAHRPQGYVCRSNGATEALRWTCDTLSLDATRLRMFMVWRAHVTLSSAKESGHVAIALAEPSQKLDFADVARLSGLTGDEGSGSTQVLSRGGKRKGTLPMRGTDKSSLATLKRAPLAPDETQPLPREIVAKYAGPQRKDTLPIPQVGSQPSSSLPFVQNTAPPSPPPLIRSSSPGEPSAPPMMVESLWAMGPIGTLPPIPVLPTAEVRPAELGVLSASNAAAGNGEKVPAKEKVVEVVEKNEPKAKDKPKEIIELLWYDPAALPRIRRHLAWKKIIADLKPRPSDDDFDGGLPPDKRRDPQDRRDMFGVLARGATVDAAGIEKAMADAVAVDGSFVPPFVLCAGELVFPFDEVESLKATIAAITPLATGDKKLKEALDTASELLKTPWLQSAGQVAAGVNARLKEAFAQGNRSVSARYLEDHTTRIVLEERHYLKRTVMGREWIRSLFEPCGVLPAIPAYLPESLSKELPMFERFRVRMMVEARGQVDQYEKHAVALRVVAMGMVVGRGA